MVKVSNYIVFPARIIHMMQPAKFALLAAWVLHTAILSHGTVLRHESLEDYNSRMEWFANAHYGMFVHFGLYSVMGGVWKGEETDWYSEWIQASKDIPREDYAMTIGSFNPLQFDAHAMVALAKESGMQYLVITSKHHEGFCLWDSDYTDFDVAATPFAGRDILGELKAACDKQGIRFGIYYSIIDWNHPSQRPNTEGKWPFSRWGNTIMESGKKDEYLTYMTHQLVELMDRYKPDLMWFDGDWTPWWSVEDGIVLYNALLARCPSMIVNNRVSRRDEFKLDFVTQEQEHFKNRFPMHWEACYTLNKSWGYKGHDHEWKDAQTVYEKLRDINLKGGNLLLNVGPDGRGAIQPEAIAILREVGRMLREVPIVKEVPRIGSMPMTSGLQ